MTKHFHRDLENLQKEILSLSSRVEDMIDTAGRCLFEPNRELAQEVIKADKQVDQREVSIEEECLKMLVLHQPVAIDLRRIAAVLKINHDLERIGDLAVSIVQRVTACTGGRTFACRPNLNEWPCWPPAWCAAR